MNASWTRADRKKSIVLLSLAAASVWMLIFVYRYGVNLFYYDTWDIIPEILNGKTWGQIFTLQFGPHRMGLGIWLTKVTMELFRWDARAESYAIAALMIGAAILALRLKSKLIPKWSLWDVLLVSHFLSLASWESLVGTAQLAFGAVPLFLIFAGALALSISDPKKRIALIVPLAFTCHGQLAVPFLLGSIVLEGFFTRDPRTRGVAAVASALILLMCGYLFATYQTGMEGTDCLISANTGLWGGLMFIGAYTMSALGFYMYLPPFPVVGALLYLSLVGLWVFLVMMVLKGKCRDPLLRVVVYLIGFTVLHGALTAYGRSCLGARAGYTSRYFVYMLPGYVGFFLWARSLSNLQWQRMVLGAMLVSHLALQAFLYLHQLPKVARDMESRRAIVSCLLGGDSIGDCEKRVGYRIHPGSMETGIPEELARFKRLGLGIYAP